MEEMQMAVKKTESVKDDAKKTVKKAETPATEKEVKKAAPAASGSWSA